MSPRTPDNCPHDLRPGTTVCLHCRHDARISGRARTRRTLARVGVIGMVLMVCAAASSGLSALQRSRGPATDKAPDDSAATITPRAATAAAPERVPTSPGLLPRLAPGRSALRMPAVVAQRDGDVVTIHFDEIMTRTRRPDKFERIVRATLPEVYGAADSMLAAVKPGALVGSDDLVTELPVRGIRLPHPSGAALLLWPETRPGRDGPLVVAYRVTVAQ